MANINYSINKFSNLPKIYYNFNFHQFNIIYPILNLKKKFTFYLFFFSLLVKILILLKNYHLVKEFYNESNFHQLLIFNEYLSYIFNYLYLINHTNIRFF
jgi:hypothetical protein